jgi:DNA-binding LacI/PurR family transcriptional regulator
LRKSKPTMREVAQLANVSATTVWMVIHEKPGIPSETIEKVWKAINELEYVVKRENKQPSNTSVGLLIEQSTIPTISDVFYGDVIRGFQAQADHLGYHVILSMFDRNKQQIELLKTGFIQKVAGFVVANDGDIALETVIQLEIPDVPVVLIESYIDGQTLPCVLGDNFSAGYKIARHIVNKGHRGIAILRGPTKYSSLLDRFRGCLAALAEENILVPPEWLPEPMSGHPLKGYVQMQEILSLSCRPTAVIAISDKTAFGALQAIQEAGLRIPKDIAIGSIDNTLESKYTRPPLTTVHIPKYEIGLLAMQNLHRLIVEGETIPVKNVVYSELIVRDSC